MSRKLLRPTVESTYTGRFAHFTHGITNADRAAYNTIMDILEAGPINPTLSAAGALAAIPPDQQALLEKLEKAATAIDEEVAHTHTVARENKDRIENINEAKNVVVAEIAALRNPVPGNPAQTTVNADKANQLELTVLRKLQGALETPGTAAGGTPIPESGVNLMALSAPLSGTLPLNMASAEYQTLLTATNNATKALNTVESKPYNQIQHIVSQAEELTQNVDILADIKAKLETGAAAGDSPAATPIGLLIKSIEDFDAEIQKLKALEAKMSHPASAEHYKAEFQAQLDKINKLAESIGTQFESNKTILEAHADKNEQKQLKTLTDQVRNIHNLAIDARNTWLPTWMPKQGSTVPQVGGNEGFLISIKPESAERLAAEGGFTYQKWVPDPNDITGKKGTYETKTAMSKDAAGNEVPLKLSREDAKAAVAYWNSAQGKADFEKNYPGVPYQKVEFKDDIFGKGFTIKTGPDDKRVAPFLELMGVVQERRAKIQTSITLAPAPATAVPAGAPAVAVPPAVVAPVVSPPPAIPAPAVPVTGAPLGLPGAAATPAVVAPKWGI